MEGERDVQKMELLYSCCHCSQWASDTRVITVRNNRAEKHFCSSACYENWRVQQTPQTDVVSSLSEPNKA